MPSNCWKTRSLCSRWKNIRRTLVCCLTNGRKKITHIDHTWQEHHMQVVTLCTHGRAAIFWRVTFPKRCRYSRLASAIHRGSGRREPESSSSAGETINFLHIFQRDPQTEVEGNAIDLLILRRVPIVIDGSKRKHASSMQNESTRQDTTSTEIMEYICSGSQK